MEILTSTANRISNSIFMIFFLSSTSFSILNTIFSFFRYLPCSFTQLFPFTSLSFIYCHCLHIHTTQETSTQAENLSCFKKISFIKIYYSSAVTIVTIDSGDWSGQYETCTTIEMLFKEISVQITEKIFNAKWLSVKHIQWVRKMESRFYFFILSDISTYPWYYTHCVDTHFSSRPKKKKKN